VCVVVFFFLREPD